MPMFGSNVRAVARMAKNYNLPLAELRRRQVLSRSQRSRKVSPNICLCTHMHIGETSAVNEEWRAI